jgi:hypothetical protein
MTRFVPWLLRVAWAVLPFTAGPGLAAALDDRSLPVRTTASVGLWAVWAVVLVATLVPHPIALTVLRIAAPAGAAASAVAALGGHVPLGAAWWVVVLAVAFLPETGAWFVNGPAYPNERRFLLRAPGALLLGPLPLAWAVVVAAPTAGALLLAAEQWLLGALVLIIGLPLAGVLARSLHGLSRRWLVFVPAGVVVHDDLALADAMLFQRRGVKALRPAPADSDALDLSRGALGLALELVLGEPVTVNVTAFGTPVGKATTCTAMLLTPTRPGAVLAEAGSRRIPRSS